MRRPCVVAASSWPVFFVTSALLFAPRGMVSAQQAEPEPPGRWQAGMLHVTPLVEVRDIGIDTNLFNEAVDPKSDFTFVASPQAKASVGFPVGRLTFGSQVDLVYFQRYDTERSVNTNTNLGFELPINRLQLRGVASYLNARRRQNSEIDARVRGTEADVVLGGAVQVSGVTTLGLEVRGTRIAYNGDPVFDGEHLPSRLDRDETRLRTSFRYSVTPLTTLVAHTDLERWRFGLSPLRDANSFRVFPGVEFDASALLSGRAYLGYRMFDSLDPTLPTFKGLVGSLDLTYTLREATRLSIIFDRDLTYSYRRDRPYYLLTSWTGSVRQKLGSGMEVEARGGVETLDYSVASDGTSISPPEDVYRYGVRLSYALGQNSRILVNLAHRNRTSSIDRRNYQALQAGVSAIYGF